MKTLGTALISFIALAAFGYYIWTVPVKDNKRVSHSAAAAYKKAANAKAARMRAKATEAERFVKSHNYNSDHCFMIDMSIPSGEWRFFVYNLKADSVEHAGLVAHGSGSARNPETLEFSNEPGSLATSLGKYRIGNSYMGSFGLAYKLYGLENTNSKAYERCVVLHGHGCVPESEIAPDKLCLSWGCPTVAPAFLNVLQEYIDGSSKPVLLWIYN